MLKVNFGISVLFYWPEHNKRGDPIELNFESLDMQKWNIPTGRAQKVDNKMGYFVLLSCLFPELWSLKLQKWFNFCIFANASKKQVTVWTKYLHDCERFYLALSENSMGC